MWSQQVAQRAIVVAGCLGMAYTQLTMSPAAIEFARAMGADGLHVGILGALPTGMLFMQFLAAIAANHLTHRRWVWITVSIVQRTLFIPLALGPLLFPGLGDPFWLWVLIGVTAANHGMLHFCSPLWLSWMGDLLPRLGLSRYWGMRHLWVQWSAAASLMIAALFLFRSGLEVRTGFSVLLIAGAILGVIDILVFLKVDEPPVAKLVQPRLREVFAAPFRDQNFRSFIGFTCFWHFSAMLGAPFISLFLLDRVGLDLFQVLMLWSFSWVGGALCSRRLGELAEEYGHRPVLILCTAFKSINMLALLLVPFRPALAFFVLVPVFMIDAVLNAGIAIANNGFMLKNSPSQNRTMFIAAGTALAGLVGGITSILTGLALKLLPDWSIPWHWLILTDYHLIFAASLSARLIAAVLARRLREPASQGTFYVVTQLIGVTPMRMLRFPVGLYRHVDLEQLVDEAAVAAVEDSLNGSMGEAIDRPMDNSQLPPRGARDVKKDVRVVQR